MISNKPWVVLAPDQVRRHPLYGFGGWDWLLVLWWLFQMLGVAFVLMFMPNPGAIAVAVILVVLAVALVLKAAIFRQVFFFYAGLCLLASLAMMVPALVPEGMSVPGGGLPPVTAITLAAAVYVALSARINVTFCHRVRQDDSFLYKFDA